MIDNLYNQTVDVERLTLVGESTTKKDYQAHLSDIACHIQPLDPKITQDIEGGFGKDKLLFCQVADIREGDRIIHGSDTYRIVGIEKYDDDIQKRSHHMEIQIRIFKS